MEGIGKFSRLQCCDAVSLGK